MNLENSKTLLVGLWNPHSKYSKTRHNIGADILERLIVQNSLELKLDKSGMYKSGTLIIEEIFDMNGDMNFDGGLNIQDIILILNLILDR